MFDRIQTVLLIVLIASSMVLSTQIWLTPAGEAGPTDVMYSPPVIDTKTLPLSALLRPHAIVLFSPGEEEEEAGWEMVVRPGHDMYEAVWDDGAIMRRLFTGLRQQEIPAAVRDEPTAGIRFLYEVELALADWMEVFQVRTPGEWPLAQVGEFHLFMTDDTLFLGADGMKAQVDLRVRYGLTEEMQALLAAVRDESRESAQDEAWEYRPPESFAGAMLRTSVLVPGHNVVPHYMYQESYDAEGIVEAIFFDHSVPRRIEERDGSVIYTDERRGVRIYPQAGWEYTAPLGSGAVKITTELEALALAVAFTQHHGGISYDMRISSLARHWHGDRESWVVGFSQDVSGIAVTGSSSPIRVHVGPHGVEGYWRNLSFAAGPMRSDMHVIGPEDALVSLTETLGFSDGRDDGGLAVDCLRLVYWRSQRDEDPPVVFPVWYARLRDGRRVVVDGHTGQVTLGW